MLGPRHWPMPSSDALCFASPNMVSFFLFGCCCCWCFTSTFWCGKFMKRLLIYPISCHFNDYRSIQRRNASHFMAYIDLIEYPLPKYSKRILTETISLWIRSDLSSNVAKSKKKKKKISKAAEESKRNKPTKKRETKNECKKHLEWRDCMWILWLLR